jgi:hypothetical protein
MPDIEESSDLQRVPWRKLLNDYPLEALLIASVLLGIVARMTAFSLGYAIDDYRYFSDERALAVGARPMLLSQGRFGLVLLIDTMRWLGLTISGDYVLGTLLLTVSFAGLAAVTVRWAGIVQFAPIAAVSAFIFVLHPYQVEYFTFRESLLLISVPVILTALSLSIRGTSAWKLLLSAAVLLTAITMWQTALVLFSTASLFAASCRFVASEEFDIRARILFAVRESRLARNALVGVSALLSYLILFHLISGMLDVQPIERTRLLGATEIPSRMWQMLILSANVLYRSEPVFPHGPKLLILGLFTASVLTALLRTAKWESRKAWFPILAAALLLPAALLGCSTAAAAAPHTWWPVPRVLIPVAWFWAFLAACGLIWLERYGGKTALRIGQVVAAIAIVSMIGMNNQVLSDQIRLNLRDQAQANRIIGRLEAMPEFESVSRLLIVGGSWGYPSPIATVQGDLNTSALYAEWSKLPLIAEVSGYRLQPVMQPEEDSRLRSLCVTGQAWPSKGSIHIVGEAAVVCLRSSR